MKKMFLSVVALAFLLAWLPATQAATEAEIEESIQNGIDWLVAQQNLPGDGSWPAAHGYSVAPTGLAVLKLCDRANELEEYDSPFDPAYPYRANVIAGLDYIFRSLTSVTLSMQGANDPDTDGDGVGFTVVSTRPVYEGGIALTAIAATGTPSRTVGSIGSAVDDSTYLQVAQDIVDWMAYAQTDAHWDYGVNQCGRGGWYYSAINNGSAMSDNSNSGYATLGIAASLELGCTIPGFVLTELNHWIGCIQDPSDGDANDGGSWYRNIGDNSVSSLDSPNLLKTGNLILEMLLAGDSSNPPTTRMQAAVDYLAAHWSDPAVWPWPDGWDGNPADYQTMFLVMKGLEAAQIDELPGPIDWFAEFADSIVAQQIPQDDPNPAIRGSWQSTIGSGGYGFPVLITDWALLTLEKVTPIVQYNVFVDIKPQSCPNPINSVSKGVLPVAILGTEDFDVMSIDPSTVLLEGVAPLRYNYSDVATPFEGELCDCHELGPDGWTDMTLKFDKAAIVAAIAEMSNSEAPLNALLLNNWEIVRLALTGMTWEGIPIFGEDCARVMWKSKGPADGGDPIEPGGSEITEVTLDVRYPGSFVSGTRISFALREPTHVTLCVYDVAGRRVKTLLDRAMPDGIHSIVWDGKDSAGKSASSGVYFIRMSAPGIEKAAKMIIIE
jgi:hypothetical protein